MAPSGVLPRALFGDHAQGLGREQVAHERQGGVEVRALVGGHRRARVARHAAPAVAGGEVAREGRVEEVVGDEDVVYGKHGGEQRQCPERYGTAFARVKRFAGSVSARGA